MPIRVEHGGRAGTTAGQIIARSGMAELQRQLQQSMQSERIRAQQQAQAQQIEAQAAGQVRAAGIDRSRMVLGAGLQGQARESQHGNELDMMQQRMDAEVEQFGLELSIRDKQKQASSIAAQNNIMNNPDFNDEQKVAAIKRIQLSRAGLGPTVPSDKPKYPEGQDIGNVWSTDNGTVLSRKPDGSVHLILRPDQTLKHQQEKDKATSAAKIFEAQTKQQERNDNMVMDLLTEEIESPDPKNPAVTIKKRREPEDVKKIMQDYLELTGQLRKSDEQQPEGQAGASWVEEAKAQGINAQEKDLDMPPKAGQAQAILRTLKDKYKGRGFKDMTEEEQMLAEQAAAVLERFEKYKKSQEKRGKRWR